MILTWAKRVQAKISLSSVWEDLKNTKSFDTIQKCTNSQNSQKEKGKVKKGL